METSTEISTSTETLFTDNQTETTKIPKEKAFSSVKTKIFQPKTSPLEPLFTSGYNHMQKKTLEQQLENFLNTLKERSKARFLKLKKAHGESTALQPLDTEVNLKSYAEMDSKSGISYPRSHFFKYRVKKPLKPLPMLKKESEQPIGMFPTREQLGKLSKLQPLPTVKMVKVLKQIDHPTEVKFVEVAEEPRWRIKTKEKNLLKKLFTGVVIRGELHSLSYAIPVSIKFTKVSGRVGTGIRV